MALAELDTARALRAAARHYDAVQANLRAVLAIAPLATLPALELRASEVLQRQADVAALLDAAESAATAAGLALDNNLTPELGGTPTVMVFTVSSAADRFEISLSSLRFKSIRCRIR